MKKIGARIAPSVPPLLVNGALSRSAGEMPADAAMT